MAKVSFTQNLRRHVSCPEATGAGDTVRAVLDSVFADNPTSRGYVLDEQGALRQHMAIFVDGAPISDRDQLSDPVGPDAEICVMQALSGG